MCARRVLAYSQFCLNFWDSEDVLCHNKYIIFATVSETEREWAGGATCSWRNDSYICTSAMHYYYYSIDRFESSVKETDMQRRSSDQP